VAKQRKKHTDEESLEIIDIVVNRIAPKYTFNGYDIDDIKQESFIICLEALKRYDNKRPLENFLSVNLSNRLKNFVRDNFGHSKDVEKKKLHSPSSITANIANSYHYYDFDDEYLDRKTMMDTIEQNLPPSLREDYLKFINNVYLNKNKRESLIKTIKDILECSTQTSQIEPTEETE
jgi:DNA-directed RNA polymerase specialized sigma24 family protein